MVFEITRLCEAKEYLRNKKVVIFDLDDTLYSEIDYVKSGYAEIAKKYTAISDMANKLWYAFKNGKHAINYVLEHENLFSQENLNCCLDIYRNHKPQIMVYPEAKELLEALKKAGTHIGMITDGRPEGQKAKISALGLDEYFEKIIITDELGGVEFRKPNVIAFEKMRDFFNIPYESMVYIGDNIKKDFIAPQKLGMDSIYFKNPSGLYYNSNK